MSSLLSNLLGGPKLTLNPASVKAWAKRSITSRLCAIRTTCEPFRTSVLGSQGRRWTLRGPAMLGLSNLIHHLVGTATTSRFTAACSAWMNSPGVLSTDTIYGAPSAQRLLRSLLTRLSVLLGRFSVLKSGEAMGKFYTEEESPSSPVRSGVEERETEDPMSKSSSPMPPLPLSPEAALIRHDLVESSSILSEVVPPGWGAGADLVRGVIELAKLIGEERRGDRDRAPSKPKIISPGGRTDPITEARKHPKKPFVPPTPVSAPKPPRKHVKKTPTEATKALPEPKPRKR